MTPGHSMAHITSPAPPPPTGGSIAHAHTAPMPMLPTLIPVPPPPRSLHRGLEQVPIRAGRLPPGVHVRIRNSGNARTWCYSSLGTRHQGPWKPKPENQLPDPCTSNSQPVRVIRDSMVPYRTAPYCTVLYHSREGSNQQAVATAFRDEWPFVCITPSPAVAEALGARRCQPAG